MNAKLAIVAVLAACTGCTSLTASTDIRLYTPSVVCVEGYRCPFEVLPDSRYIRSRLPYGCPDLDTRWVAFDSNKDIGFCRSLFEYEDIYDRNLRK